MMDETLNRFYPYHQTLIHSFPSPFCNGIYPNIDIQNTVIENKLPIIPSIIGVVFLFLIPKKTAITPKPHETIEKAKIFPATQFAAKDIDLWEDSVKNNEIVQIRNEAHGYERLIIPKVIDSFCCLFSVLFI